MQIEITHKHSFVNMDAVITHNNEELIIPMNYRFTGNAYLDHPGQLVSELNQNWSRRTDDNKNRMFKLYRCIRRCWDNHLDYKTGKLDEFEVLVRSVAPYMVELLNNHNVDQLAHHMEDWYKDVVPEDLVDHSDDPMVYTYDDYKELQAAVLAMRSIWPAVEMLRSAVPDYRAGAKLMRIHVNVMAAGTDLYHSRAINRLYQFVEAYVRKNGAGDPNQLMAGLLFKRLTHYPLTSAPHGASLITDIYKFLANESRLPPEAIQMKSEYRFDFVPMVPGEKHFAGEVKGVKFTNDKK